mmetsp:Transcript_128112/g.410689  ORF Transcript_128112/g.410689 Transcript_128112/m.410689 type:complete len:479 (-) Transcript_128112:94-1530(-)
MADPMGLAGGMSSARSEEDSFDDSWALVGNAARLVKKRPHGKNPALEFHGARPAESWPSGSGKAIGLQEHMGETAIAKALGTKFNAMFRGCESIGDVQKTASKLEENLKKHMFTHRALVVSVNRRVCELLAKGWPTPDHAFEDLQLLHSLRQENLMAPWRVVKEAITGALVMLSSSGGQWRASSSAMHGPGDSPQQALNLWLQQTHVFAQFSEAGFLMPEDFMEVERALDAQLKQILNRIPSSEMLRYAAYLRAGGSFILRARAAVESGIHMMPPSTIKPVPVKGDLPPEVPTFVSVAAFDAIRAAGRAGGLDEKVAPKASVEMSQLGFDDPTLEKSVMGRRPSRSSSDSALVVVTAWHGGSPKKPSGVMLGHHDILRRASALSLVRGHVGCDARPAPSHARGEVVAGIGAVGHVGSRSGVAFNGLAPVGLHGMSALQKNMLQVHASRADAGQPERSPRRSKLMAFGRAAHCTELRSL